MTVSEPKTLVVILAHPDDESFGMGGTLALYARQGAKVYYICMTGGESGTVDPHFLEKYSSIADLRYDELKCASEKLGLAGFLMAGYRDSGMPGTPDNAHPAALVNQPVEAVAARLVHFIRELRPQVIVTHDPIGGYKHPDHIATHHAVLRAFHTAGDASAYPAEPLPPFAPQKLYYTTFPKMWMRLLVWLMPLFGQNPRRFGRNKDIDILSLVEEGDFPIHTRVDYTAVAGIRDAASACHASQLEGGPPRRGLVSWLFRLMRQKDTYMRAHPPAENSLRERDLFEGVSG
ncbi:MAG: PIG-L family deacetylase [Anaerolineales bacterium]|nr:PIG-L family deacetylase [Anaerolineales bacterium]